MSSQPLHTRPRGAVVITTISSPTRAVIEWAAIARKLGWMVVCVGDSKTPNDWHCDGVDYLSLGRQVELYGDLANSFPRNHYCRKNLGYVYAIERGVEYIFDTDDDNYPILGLFEDQLAKWLSDRMVDEIGTTRWVNVYAWFGRPDLWPRGNPLHAHAWHGQQAATRLVARPAVVQFLVNGDPDIDAVQRLLEDRPFVSFAPRPRPVSLAAESWCSFNSQATLFSREAFPLLYLPCDVSFRMTDIWRSFVALAVLKARRGVVAFDEPIAYQLRNAHNLLKDFQDEVVGYLNNDRIVDMLAPVAGSTAEDSVTDLALRSFELLSEGGIVPAGELQRHEGFISRLKG